jgi:hypothetical protein
VRLLLTAILISAIPLAPLRAQSAVTSPLPIATPSSEFRLAPSKGLDDHLASKGGTSYWAEGGGIGAGILAVLGVVTAASMCSDSDSSNDSCFGPVVGLGLLGAGVGLTIGALVGARFPKH